ncbi:hypothetical protein GIB67_004933 [Kingdonia uniflora]|uniref:Uncharacterized protein n=1 Tax=Kingdonia uniflora TaxID=39325 RepID=A0A7J7LVT8_9MAGN|nr:hypothetical protein GIB67_004933 [Kingdonia uniflora]
MEDINIEDDAFLHMFTTERNVFNNLVLRLGRNGIQAKYVIGLWLWLVQLGYSDLIKKIKSLSDLAINALYDETLLCLRRVMLEPVEIRVGGYSRIDDIPILATLMNGNLNIDSGIFEFARKLARDGINGIVTEVCSRIFTDTAAREVQDPVIQPVFRPHGEGCSSSLFYGHCSDVSSTLINPFAMPFYSRLEQTSGVDQIPDEENDRTLFLTFSRGYPITREQIVGFFISKWGEVVERLIFGNPLREKESLCACLLLTSKSAIATILGRQHTAEFYVNGRCLRARRSLTKDERYRLRKPCLANFRPRA